MNRAILLAAGVLLSFTTQATGGPRTKPVSKDALAAARLLQSWQFAQARELIETLPTTGPGSMVGRYLQAELDFTTGSYQKALLGLQGLADDEVNGNVGALRSLLASTVAVTTNFVSHKSKSGRFEIYFAPGKEQVIAELTGEVLDAAYDALAADLGHSPDTPIRVELLQRPADLARLSTLTVKEIETTGTIALCKYGKLMVVTPRATVFGYPWMDTLTHEYVHFVVTQMSHDNVPVWLHEGIARFLETRWRKEADGMLNSKDEHLLARATAKGKLISFDDMHPSMAKLPSQEAAALAFAEVYTMVAFIHKQVGNKGLREIIRRQIQRVDARSAVAAAMGREWTKVERDWKHHLHSLGLKSRRASIGQKRIRFKKGSDKDDNVDVESLSNKTARKATRLAGMLRARGHLAAAAAKYEIAHKASGRQAPFVAAKLSRVYLEMGRYQDAIKTAKPLLGIDPMDATPSTTIGAAYLALGDYSEAQAALEDALQITPFDPVVRCGLSETYAQQDDNRARREREACQLLRGIR